MTAPSRMLLGLIRPSACDVVMLGTSIRPGEQMVFARVGSLNALDPAGIVEVRGRSVVLGAAGGTKRGRVHFVLLQQPVEGAPGDAGIARRL